MFCVGIVGKDDKVVVGGMREIVCFDSVGITDITIVCSIYFFSRRNVVWC